MSTAANHRKRSHRSQYRARAFNGARRSVVAPSLKRSGFLAWIRKIRQAVRKAKQKESANHAEGKPV